VTELDGKRQRIAFTAAERSLQALGAGNGERAVRSASKAMDLDQRGLFGGLPEAVAAASGDIEVAGVVSDESWDRLEDVVGSGPLQFLIRELRG
jgi:hypothetical protein